MLLPKLRNLRHLNYPWLELRGCHPTGNYRPSDQILGFHALRTDTTPRALSDSPSSIAALIASADVHVDVGHPRDSVISLASPVVKFSV